MREWDVTSESLSAIAADDPVACALNTKEHGFLEKPGWQRFKRLAKLEKRLLRLQNKDKLRSRQESPIC